MSTSPANAQAPVAGAVQAACAACGGEWEPPQRRDCSATRQSQGLRAATAGLLRKVRGAVQAATLAALLLPALALAGPATFEAEAIGSSARIVTGGELLLIHDSPDGRIAFSGGAAVSFVPAGQLCGLELTLPVAKPGIYRLRFTAVLGPSCGVYHILVDGERRGWQSFTDPRTHHIRDNATQPYGVQTRRFEVKGDRVTIQFINEGPGLRGRNLVLDRLELLPEPKPSFPAPEASDPVAPGEQYGPELVTNGGFEAFVPTDLFVQQHQFLRGWGFNSALPTGQPVLVHDPAQAQAGQVVACLAPDPLEDNAIFYQHSIQLRHGHRYRLTFHARGTGMVNVTFYQSTPSRDLGDTVRGAANFALTPEWQQLSLLFTPSAKGQVEQAACSFAALFGSRLYLDNVSLRELLP